MSIYLHSAAAYLASITCITVKMEFPEATPFCVNNEDCDLHSWRIGSGPLIVFIPGGNGYARQFFPIMNVLSERFTCATFDRRQMSSSKVKNPKLLDMNQQERDVIAIIKAVGFEKAIIFGSSFGAILGYAIAADHPQVVQQLIAHEAPIGELCTDPERWRKWNQKLWDVKERDGWRAAQDLFVTELIGYDDEGIPKMGPPEWDNVENQWTNEIPVLFKMSIKPILERAKANGVKIGVMRGRRSRDAMYADSVSGQEVFLGCPAALVPGHHQGYENETAEFTPYLLAMIDLLKV